MDPGAAHTATAPAARVKASTTLVRQCQRTSRAETTGAWPGAARRPRCGRGRAAPSRRWPPASRRASRTTAPPWCAPPGCGVAGPARRPGWDWPPAGAPPGGHGPARARSRGRARRRREGAAHQPAGRAGDGGGAVVQALVEGAPQHGKPERRYRRWAAVMAGGARSTTRRRPARSAGRPRTPGHPPPLAGHAAQPGLVRLGPALQLLLTAQRPAGGLALLLTAVEHPHAGAGRAAVGAGHVRPSHLVAVTTERDDHEEDRRHCGEGGAVQHWGPRYNPAPRRRPGAAAGSGPQPRKRRTASARASGCS